MVSSSQWKQTPIHTAKSHRNVEKRGSRKNKQANRRLHQGMFPEALETRALMACDLGQSLENQALFSSLQAGVDALASSIEVSASQFRISADAGDTRATAMNLGALQPAAGVTGSVSSGDLRDVFKFTIGATSKLSVNLAGLSADATLLLADASGQILVASTRPGLAAEAIVTNLVKGEYYVAVDYVGPGVSNYQLSLRVDASSSTTPADIFTGAIDLGAPTRAMSRGDSVGAANPLDVFKLTVTASRRFEFSLTGVSGGTAPALLVYDRQKNLVGSSFSTSSSVRSLAQNLASGEYYVVVASQTPAARISYQLNITPAALPTTPPSSTPPKTTPPSTTPPSTTPPTTSPPSTTPPSKTTPVTAFPDVANFGGANEWNLNSINAPEVWARGYTGQNVLVAVVDTGVDISHPDLSSRIYVNPREIAGDGIDNDGNGFVDDVRGWDFANRDNNAADGNGHGTHVAGTIAASNNGVGATGVAYNAKILPVKVLGDNGSGSMQSVADGIRYAVNMGAKVVNLSLGASVGATVVQAALAYAESRGVFVVAASGNESAATPGFPASYSKSLTNVLSIGAYTSGNARASFSNRVGSSGAVQIDAPGASIFSTLPGNRYGQLSGTSMATPHVAGVAALALSANPNLTPSQLRQILVNGSNRTISGSDSKGGVNAAFVVAYAVAGGTTSQASASAQYASGAVSTGARSVQQTIVLAAAAEHGIVEDQAPSSTVAEQNTTISPAVHEAAAVVLANLSVERRDLETVLTLSSKGGTEPIGTALSVALDSLLGEVVDEFLENE